MNVTVNKKPVELPVSAGITDLIQQLNLPSAQSIAIAVNQQVIPKSEWNTCILKDNDEILLIRATQGG
jgi:sulfur carrier protein